MAKPDLTAQRLRELLNYDPETGIFRWRMRSLSEFKSIPDWERWHTKFLEAVAGHHRSDGYYDIRVDGFLHRSHRLAWLYMTGEWPARFIDHIDRDPSNAAWKNLRQATPGQNRQNQKQRKDSNQIYKGVEYRGLKFRARIAVNGRRIELGAFDTAEEALQARIEGERKHFTHSPACEPRSAYPEAAPQPDGIGLAPL